MKIMKIFAILTCFDAYTISGISRRSRLKGDIYYEAGRAMVRQEVAKIWPGQLIMGSRKSRPKRNSRLQRFLNHHRKN